LVIPPTDTPGGSVAGAGAFLLFAIDHGMSGLKPKDYTDVATALDAAAGAGGFLHLSRARQEALLTAFDAQAFGPSASDPAAVAWRALKPAIVVGYYSSEIGASQELVFEAVPGPERRNFKLSADYRARSNEGFGGGF
jgi:Gluconate 2-dehydrogenase subunit 3